MCTGGYKFPHNTCLSRMLERLKRTYCTRKNMSLNLSTPLSADAPRHRVDAEGCDAALPSVNPLLPSAST